MAILDVTRWSTDDAGVRIISLKQDPGFADGDHPIPRPFQEPW
jgi:hypothetical protein